MATAEKKEEYKALLREAIKKAKEAAPGAVDDLVECASFAAEAVAGVTDGKAALELVPIEAPDIVPPAYQLQLRKTGSEAPVTDLGVYQVSADGYPVRRWYSRAKWSENRDALDCEPMVTRGQLEGHFRWMISHPESRLVGFLTFFQQQPQVESESGRGKKPKR